MLLYPARRLSVKLKPAAGLVGLAILLLLGHQLSYAWALGWDSVDDAYISFRYGQNLLKGLGLVFNPGERVEGYTNFLWTLLLALPSWLGIFPGQVAMALGALLALGVVLLTFPLMRKLDPQVGLLAALPALLLAADGSFVLWSVSGLETALFAFLLMLAIWAYLGEEKDMDKIPWSGALFALASLARPEGVLALLVAVGHRAFIRLVEERRPLAWQDLARLALFGALFGPYFLWRYTYYGYLLPNTFYAKVTTEGTSAQLARGWAYLGRFIWLHLGYAFLLVPGLALIRRRSLFATSFLASLVVAFSLYIAYVGGDWSVGRFFVPILPAFYLLTALGLANILTLVGRPLPKLAGWGLSGTLVATLALTSSYGGEYRLFIQPFQAGLATQARVAMGKWLGKNLPRGTLIAVDAAGQIPYYSGLPALDIFGINDLHTAHLQVKTMGQGTPGHEKLDLAYVLERRPAYIIIYGNMLDSVAAYERAELPWTSNPTLRGFLNIYLRKT